MTTERYLRLHQPITQQYVTKINETRTTIRHNQNEHIILPRLDKRMEVSFEQTF